MDIGGLLGGSPRRGFFSTSPPAHELRPLPKKIPEDMNASRDGASGQSDQLFFTNKMISTKCSENQSS
jgi:hypothetical protein